MNKYAEKLIKAYIECPQHIKGMLDKWETFDDDLKEHHDYEITWFFDRAKTYVEENPDDFNHLLKDIALADEALASMAAYFETKFGWRPEPVLGK